MEGLRKLGHSAFRHQAFVRAGSEFRTITISASDTHSAAYQPGRLSEDEVRDFVKRPGLMSNVEGDAKSSFQLVSILRLDNNQVCISPDTFRLIFEKFQLDSSILYLIKNNIYGFHRLPASRSSSPKEGHIYCFYIATVIYTLVWSFNPKNMTTKAVLLIRSHNCLNKAGAAFETFEEILSHYKEYIFTPRLLAFVATVQTMQYLDTFMINQKNLMHEIESFTGQGVFVYRSVKLKEPEDILNKITQLSKRVGGCLIDIARQQLHAKVVESLFDFLDHSENDANSCSAEMHKSCLSKHDALLVTLKTALPVLRQRLATTDLENLYLQDRARNQSTVLLGLSTHQDAIIGTNLANSSQEIAAATKKDGEAMKTIAIMTMMFLPATFFAALFAVPSLQWDKQPVIQEDFWIYWAFTLPSTGIVFVVWFGLTKWSWSQIRTMLPRRARTKKLC